MQSRSQRRHWAGSRARSPTKVRGLGRCTGHDTVNSGRLRQPIDTVTRPRYATTIDIIVKRFPARGRVLPLYLALLALASASALAARASVSRRPSLDRSYHGTRVQSLRRERQNFESDHAKAQEISAHRSLARFLRFTWPTLISSPLMSYSCTVLLTSCVRITYMTLTHHTGILYHTIICF